MADRIPKIRGGLPTDALGVPRQAGGAAPVRHAGDFRGGRDPERDQLALFNLDRGARDPVGPDITAVHQALGALGLVPPYRNIQTPVSTQRVLLDAEGGIETKASGAPRVLEKNRATPEQFSIDAVQIVQGLAFSPDPAIRRAVSEAFLQAARSSDPNAKEAAFRLLAAIHTALPPKTPLSNVSAIGDPTASGYGGGFGDITRSNENPSARLLIDALQGNPDPTVLQYRAGVEDFGNRGTVSMERAANIRVPSPEGYQSGMDSAVRPVDLDEDPNKAAKDLLYHLRGGIPSDAVDATVQAPPMLRRPAIPMARREGGVSPGVESGPNQPIREAFDSRPTFPEQPLTVAYQGTALQVPPFGRDEYRQALERAALEQMLASKQLPEGATDPIPPDSGMGQLLRDQLQAMPIHQIRQYLDGLGVPNSMEDLAPRPVAGHVFARSREPVPALPAGERREMFPGAQAADLPPDLAAQIDKGLKGESVTATPDYKPELFGKMRASEAPERDRLTGLVIGASQGSTQAANTLFRMAQNAKGGQFRAPFANRYGSGLTGDTNEEMALDLARHLVHEAFPDAIMNAGGAVPNTAQQQRFIESVARTLLMEQSGVFEPVRPSYDAVPYQTVLDPNRDPSKPGSGQSRRAGSLPDEDGEQPKTEAPPSIQTAFPAPTTQSPFTDMRPDTKLKPGEARLRAQAEGYPHDPAKWEPPAGDGSDLVDWDIDEHALRKGWVYTADDGTLVAVPGSPLTQKDLDYLRRFETGRSKSTATDEDVGNPARRLPMTPEQRAINIASGQFGHSPEFRELLESRRDFNFKKYGQRPGAPEGTPRTYVQNPGKPAEVQVLKTPRTPKSGQYREGAKTDIALMPDMPPSWNQSLFDDYKPSGRATKGGKLPPSRPPDPNSLLQFREGENVVRQSAEWQQRWQRLSEATRQELLAAHGRPLEELVNGSRPWSLRDSSVLHDGEAMDLAKAYEEGSEAARSAISPQDYRASATRAEMARRRAAGETMWYDMPAGGTDPAVAAKVEELKKRREQLTAKLPKQQGAAARNTTAQLRQIDKEISALEAGPEATPQSQAPNVDEKLAASDTPIDPPTTQGLAINKDNTRLVVAIINNPASTPEQLKIAREYALLVRNTPNSKGFQKQVDAAIKAYKQRMSGQDGAPAPDPSEMPEEAGPTAAEATLPPSPAMEPGKQVGEQKEADGKWYYWAKHGSWMPVVDVAGPDDAFRIMNERGSRSKKPARSVKESPMSRLRGILDSYQASPQLKELVKAELAFRADPANAGNLTKAGSRKAPPKVTATTPSKGATKATKAATAGKPQVAPAQAAAQTQAPAQPQQPAPSTAPQQQAPSQPTPAPDPAPPAPPPPPPRQLTQVEAADQILADPTSHTDAEVEWAKQVKADLDAGIGEPDNVADNLNAAATEIVDPDAKPAKTNAEAPPAEKPPKPPEESEAPKTEADPAANGTAASPNPTSPAPAGKGSLRRRVGLGLGVGALGLGGVAFFNRDDSPPPGYRNHPLQPSPAAARQPAPRPADIASEGAGPRHAPAAPQGGDGYAPVYTQQAPVAVPQAPNLESYRINMEMIPSPHGVGAKPSRDVLPPPESPAEEAYKPYSRMTSEERIRAFRKLNDRNYNAATLSRF